MSSTTAGAVQYCFGEIPTKDGLPLYNFDISSPRLTTVEPTDEGLRPTPETEYRRAKLVERLRTTCEAICEENLGLPIPKDLFDHFLFLTTSCANRTGTETLFYPYGKEVEIRLIMERELFGEIVGRQISQDRLNIPRKVQKAIAFILDNSNREIEKFKEWMSTTEGLDFIRSNPEPSSLLKPSKDAPSKDTPSPEASWSTWLDKAEDAAADVEAGIARFLSVVDPYRGSPPMDVSETLRKSVASLLALMFPLVYPSIARTAHQLERPLRAYRESLGDLASNAGESETNEHNVKIRCLDHHPTEWDAEVEIQYRDDILRCRRAHYEKYRSLYDFNAAESDRPLSFEAAVYVMLRRYQTIVYCPDHYASGGNMHAAAPEKVFHYLADQSGVQFECFASPNNCFFRRYCSAFRDTDAPFGSQGSFFDVEDFPAGAFEVGPPYTEELLFRVCEHIEKVLDTAGAKPLSFFVFAPDWDDCKGIQALKASRYCRAEIDGPANEHQYVIGTQQYVRPSRESHYYQPPHITKCFVLQNLKGHSEHKIDADALIDCMVGRSDQPRVPRERSEDPQTYGEWAKKQASSIARPLRTPQRKRVQIAAITEWIFPSGESLQTESRMPKKEEARIESDASRGPPALSHQPPRFPPHIEYNADDEAHGSVPPSSQPLRPPTQPPAGDDLSAYLNTFLGYPSMYGPQPLIPWDRPRQMDLKTSIRVVGRPLYGPFLSPPHYWQQSSQGPYEATPYESAAYSFPSHLSASRGFPSRPLYVCPDPVWSAEDAAVAQNTIRPGARGALRPARRRSTTARPTGAATGRPPDRFDFPSDFPSDFWRGDPRRPPPQHNAWRRPSMAGHGDAEPGAQRPRTARRPEHGRPRPFHQPRPFPRGRFGSHSTSEAPPRGAYPHRFGGPGHGGER